MAQRRLSDIIQTKLAKKPQTEEIKKQSKINSLKMSALRSLTKPLVKILLDANKSDHHQIASFIKNTLQSQALLVSDVTSVSKPESSEQNEFIWRRCLSLAAKEVANQKSINYPILLMTVSNHEETLEIYKKLGVDAHEFSKIIQSVGQYNVYREEDTFYSTVDATTLKAATTLSKRAFLSTEPSMTVELGQILNEAQTVITHQLQSSFSTNIHAKQRTMQDKTSLSHASYIIDSITREWTKKFGPISINTIDKFESDLSEKSESLVENFNNCIHLTADAMLSMPNDRDSSSVTPQLRADITSELGAGDILNCLEMFGYCTPDQGGLSHNTHTKLTLMALSDVHALMNYSEAIVVEQVIKGGNEKRKNFIRHQLFHTFAPAIKQKHESNSSLTIDHLKTCFNLSMYLLGDLPSDNEIILKSGGIASEIEKCRQSRNQAYAIGLTSIYQHEQISLPTITQITKALIQTQTFSWGLSIAYIAPKVASNILKATNALYISCREKSFGSNSSLYRAVLESAVSIHNEMWKVEVENTLSKSQRNYSRGEITLSESNKILSEFTGRYEDQIEQLTRNYSELNKLKDNSLDMSSVQIAQQVAK